VDKGRGLQLNAYELGGSAGEVSSSSSIHLL
jgi:hypothetical protein